MMRLIGLLSTATLIFVIGCGTGGYFVGKYAYVEGAKAAFSRCLDKSRSGLEAQKPEPIPSRRVRCGAAVLLSHGLDIK